jgi:hypothetical protein
MQIHDYRRIYGKVGDAYAQFEISDVDPLGAGKVTAGHSYQFFGYLTSDGAWLIMQEDTTTATSIKTYRYVGGQTHAGYLAAWTGRAALTYEYFDEATTP